MQSAAGPEGAADATSGERTRQAAPGGAEGRAGGGEGSHQAVANNNTIDCGEHASRYQSAA